MQDDLLTKFRYDLKVKHTNNSRFQQFRLSECKSRDSNNLVYKPNKHVGL